MSVQAGQMERCRSCGQALVPLHYRLPEGVTLKVCACRLCDQLVPKWSVLNA